MGNSWWGKAWSWLCQVERHAFLQISSLHAQCSKLLRVQHISQANKNQDGTDKNRCPGSWHASLTLACADPWALSASWCLVLFFPAPQPAHESSLLPGSVLALCSLAFVLGIVYWMCRIFYNSSSSCLGCFFMVQIPYLTEPQMPVYEVKAVLSCLNWNFTQQHQTEPNTPHYRDVGHTSTFWRQEVVKSKESSQEASMGRKFLSLEHLAMPQRWEGNKVVGD